MDPKITILVPTIGRMAFLPDIRRAATAQTRGDFEVLVLDNDSPAEAVAFYDDWAKSDPRVKIMRCEPRVPMFENYNRGVRAVRTEFFTIFNDDDVYLPRYFEVLVGQLEKFPGAAFAGSNWDQVDEHGTITDKRRWVKKTELWDFRRYVDELVSRGRNFLPMPGIVYRRRAFGPDGWDKNLSPYWGDCVLLMRAAEEGGVVVVEDTVVQIRRHSDQASMTSMPMSESMKLRRDVLAGYLDEYHARHPEDGAMVDRLRTRVALGYRAGLLLGWTLATDDTERRACATSLGDTTLDKAVGRVLCWAGDVGLRPPSPQRVSKVARVAAGVLRL